MVKWFGAALVTAACGTAGLGFAAATRTALRQLAAWITALECLDSEARCRMTPLPEVFAQLAQNGERAVAAFFAVCAETMRRDRTLGVPLVFRQALEQTRGLELTGQTRQTLLNLAVSLGRFDLEGQSRAIALAVDRLRQEQRTLQAGAAARCRSYETIGVCAGLALAVILW